MDKELIISEKLAEQLNYWSAKRHCAKEMTVEFASVMAECEIKANKVWAKIRLKYDLSPEKHYQVKQWNKVILVPEKANDK